MTDSDGIDLSSINMKHVLLLISIIVLIIGFAVTYAYGYQEALNVNCANAFGLMP